MSDFSVLAKNSYLRATPKPGAVGGGRCVGGPATAGRLPMGGGSACCGGGWKGRGVGGGGPPLFCIFPATRRFRVGSEGGLRPFRCGRVPSRRTRLLVALEW